MSTTLRKIMTLPLFALSYCGLSASAAGVEEVIVVFKTHFDIGYTDMASNVVHRYRTSMIDDALRVVDENRSLPAEQQFAWTIPGWPATKITQAWDGQTAERQQRVRQAFKEGRFVVHALPFSTHTELLEPEDLVRGLSYSSRLARELALDLPRDAKMTDVPSHSWIMPTLLRRAGVDFLHLGCNAASSSPRVPLLFWWEGPDGSRLLTMYSAAGYGTGLKPPADWPYPVWLALIQTGDNHGPPRPDEIVKLLTQAKNEMPGVKVRIGRLSDFSDVLLARKPAIPIVRGDMPDTWIHGPMCDPAGARIARNIRPAIAASESLRTHLQAWGAPVQGQPGLLDAAREQSLLYHEHTWGGALYWVTAYGKDLKWGYGEQWKADRAGGRFDRLEASWAEHSAYIERARQTVEPLLDGELNALARAVGVAGKRVVVFNPLPWKRDGLVRIGRLSDGVCLKPVNGGAKLPTWAEGDSSLFLARDVPASGFCTYQLVPSADMPTLLRVDAEKHVLESPSFRITLDPARGGIASMIEKKSGRELVAPGESAFGQFIHERFDADNVAEYVRSYVKIEADWATAELGKPALPPSSQVPYRKSSPTNCELSFERSPVAVTAVLKSEPNDVLPYAVSTRVSLYAGLDYVDLEVTLNGKPADPWPEAGWICLPFKLDSPQFRLGRLGGIVDPAKDMVPGANVDLGAIQSGTAIFDGTTGSGAGVCALDNPLMSLGRPGCWKYSTANTPRGPTLFVNLFNNQWTTNFRLWNSGTWRSRVRIWSMRRYDAEQGLITPSIEARHPLRAGMADGAAGALPTSERGLALSRKGVEVTAFGPNPDGDGLVLRLWECAGNAGPCKVTLPEKLSVSKVQPVDLRGRPIARAVTVRKGVFTAELEAFAPCSFVLLPASTGQGG